MSIERTLVLIKPDGVTRNLTGEILGRIEAKGYTLAELKKVNASRELLEQHYEEHVGKPFYEPLVEFMLSGPVVAADLRGPPRDRGLPLAGRHHRPDDGGARAPSAATSAATGA